MSTVPPTVSEETRAREIEGIIAPIIEAAYAYFDAQDCTCAEDVEGICWYHCTVAERVARIAYDVARNEDATARLTALEAENVALRAERLLLAKLAAETPQFDNPLHAWEAKRIRDQVLDLAARSTVSQGSEEG
jgi:hypothetical protein